MLPFRPFEPLLPRRASSRPPGPPVCVLMCACRGGGCVVANSLVACITNADATIQAILENELKDRNELEELLSRESEEKTQAKKDLIELSKSTTERFIDDLNYLGLPALSQKCPPNPQFVVNRSTEVSKGTTSVHTMYLYGCFRTWLESTGEKHGRVSESEFRHEATTNHGLELKKHRGENYYVNVHGAAWKEEEEEGNLVMFAPLTDDNY